MAALLLLASVVVLEEQAHSSCNCEETDSAAQSATESTIANGTQAESEVQEEKCESKIPGDIDCSGAVDATDRWLMERALGASPEDHDWDPRCDLNEDEFISFDDLAILEENMGKLFIDGQTIESLERSRCPLPKLRFAPAMEAAVAFSEQSEAPVELLISVSQKGEVTRVRTIESSLDFAATRALSRLVRKWYFGVGVGESGGTPLTTCVVRIVLSDQAFPGSEGALPK